MKNSISVIALFFILLNYSPAQINPLEIIDKVAGTLLPEVVKGVKEITEAKKKNKNDEAKELEENFKKKQEEAIKAAKKSIIVQIGKDIEYLKAINSIQSKIQRISTDVGRLSMFKDINFIDKLRQQEAVTVKNEIVRKFQNALEQVNENKSTLASLRDNMNSSSAPAAARAATYIETIISKLEEINSSYNDCSKLIIGGDDSKKINGCLDAIKSVSTDISELESRVANLNTEASAMLSVYLKEFETIKKSIEK